MNLADIKRRRALYRSSGSTMNNAQPITDEEVNWLIAEVERLTELQERAGQLKTEYRRWTG